MDAETADAARLDRWVAWARDTDTWILRRVQEHVGPVAAEAIRRVLNERTGFA